MASTASSSSGLSVDVAAAAVPSSLTFSAPSPSKMVQPSANVYASIVASTTTATIDVESIKKKNVGPKPKRAHVASVASSSSSISPMPSTSPPPPSIVSVPPLVSASSSSAFFPPIDPAASIVPAASSSSSASAAGNSATAPPVRRNSHATILQRSRQDASMRAEKVEELKQEKLREKEKGIEDAKQKKDERLKQQQTQAAASAAILAATHAVAAAADIAARTSSLLASERLRLDESNHAAALERERSTALAAAADVLAATKALDEARRREKVIAAKARKRSIAMAEAAAAATATTATATTVSTVVVPSEPIAIVATTTTTVLPSIMTSSPARSLSSSSSTPSLRPPLHKPSTNGKSAVSPNHPKVAHHAASAAVSPSPSSSPSLSSSSSPSPPDVVSIDAPSSSTAASTTVAASSSTSDVAVTSSIDKDRDDKMKKGVMQVKVRRKGMNKKEKHGAKASLATTTTIIAHVTDVDIDVTTPGHGDAIDGVAMTYPDTTSVATTAAVATTTTSVSSPSPSTAATTSSTTVTTSTTAPPISISVSVSSPVSPQPAPAVSRAVTIYAADDTTMSSSKPPAPTAALAAASVSNKKKSMLQQPTPSVLHWHEDNERRIAELIANSSVMLSSSSSISFASAANANAKSSPVQQQQRREIVLPPSTHLAVVLASATPLAATPTVPSVPASSSITIVATPTTPTLAPLAQHMLSREPKHRMDESKQNNAPAPSPAATAAAASVAPMKVKKRTKKKIMLATAAEAAKLSRETASSDESTTIVVVTAVAAPTATITTIVAPPTTVLVKKQSSTTSTAATMTTTTSTVPPRVPVTQPPPSSSSLASSTISTLPLDPASSSASGVPPPVSGRRVVRDLLVDYFESRGMKRTLMTFQQELAGTTPAGGDASNRGSLSRGKPAGSGAAGEAGTHRGSFTKDPSAPGSLSSSHSVPSLRSLTPIPTSPAPAAGAGSGVGGLKKPALVARLRRAFELGLLDDFFSLLESEAPEARRKLRKDKNGEKLEFWMRVYFAIFPEVQKRTKMKMTLVDSSNVTGAQPTIAGFFATTSAPTVARPPSSSIATSSAVLAAATEQCAKAMADFARYLATLPVPSSAAQSSNFLLAPYFLLPSTLDPASNESFAHLFVSGSGGWVSEMQRRVEAFVHMNVNPSKSMLALRRANAIEKGDGSRAASPSSAARRATAPTTVPAPVATRLEKIILAAVASQNNPTPTIAAISSVLASTPASPILIPLAASGGGGNHKNKRRGGGVSPASTSLVVTSVPSDSDSSSDSPLTSAQSAAQRSLALLPSGLSISPLDISRKDLHDALGMATKLSRMLNLLQMDVASNAESLSDSELSELHRRLEGLTIKSIGLQRPKIVAQAQLAASVASQAQIAQQQAQQAEGSFMRVPGLPTMLDAHDPNLASSSASASAFITWPELNMISIEHTLAVGSSLERATLLQALRWRLTRSTPSVRKRHLSMYIEQDLLRCTSSSSRAGGAVGGTGAKGKKNAPGAAGANDEFQPTETCPTLLHALFGDSDVVLQESIARMVNCMSSFTRGRAYLLLHPALISLLFSLVKSQNSDNATRRHALSALQAFSMSRSAQTSMIALGMMEWTVSCVLMQVAPIVSADNVLEQANNSLSEWTVEYATALLMNLSLRTAGKLRAEGMLGGGSSKLDIVSSLMSCLVLDAPSYRTYINGTLYSLLSRRRVRLHASSLGLTALLLRVRPGVEEAVQQQLDYILRLVNSHDHDDSAPEAADGADGAAELAVVSEDERDDEEDELLAHDGGSRGTGGGREGRMHTSSPLLDSADGADDEQYDSDGSGSSGSGGEHAHLGLGAGMLDDDESAAALASRSASSSASGAALAGEAFLAAYYHPLAREDNYAAVPIEHRHVNVHHTARGQQSGGNNASTHAPLSSMPYPLLSSPLSSSSPSSTLQVHLPHMSSLIFPPSPSRHSLRSPPTNGSLLYPVMDESPRDTTAVPIDQRKSSHPLSSIITNVGIRSIPIHPTNNSSPPFPMLKSSTPGLMVQPQLNQQHQRTPSRGITGSGAAPLHPPSSSNVSSAASAYHRPPMIARKVSSSHTKQANANPIAAAASSSTVASTLRGSHSLTSLRGIIVPPPKIASSDAHTMSSSSSSPSLKPPSHPLSSSQSLLPPASPSAASAIAMDETLRHFKAFGSRAKISRTPISSSFAERGEFAQR